MSAATQIAKNSCNGEEFTALPLPEWLGELFPGQTIGSISRSSEDISVSTIDTDGRTLVTVCIPDADRLTPYLLQRRTREAYACIAQALSDRAARYPVRFWNFIPDIHAPMVGYLDRYRVFNAGRYEAFAAWHGDIAAFDRSVATATGIGHAGADLIIHALATDRPGVQVHNPRQRRPYFYSSRYGPLPPCFARATVVDGLCNGTPLVLIGGTASVRGESSLHPGDLAAQVEETLANLATVIEAAHGVCGALTRGAPLDFAQALGRLRDVRVYYADPRSFGSLCNMIRDRLAHVHALEFIQAEICRPELGVEIEGTALVSPLGA